MQLYLTKAVPASDVIHVWKTIACKSFDCACLLELLWNHWQKRLLKRYMVAESRLISAHLQDNSIIKVGKQETGYFYFFLVHGSVTWTNSGWLNFANILLNMFFRFWQILEWCMAKCNHSIPIGQLMYFKLVHF